MTKLALSSWFVSGTCFLLFAGCGDSSTDGLVGATDGGVDATSDGGSVGSDSSEDASDSKTKDSSSDVSEDSSKLDATKPSDAGVDILQDTSKDAISDSPPDVVPSCTTRITYGSLWMHGAGQADHTDIVSGHVTWDGACLSDGANSYAVLSNGWKPFFEGNSSCVIALDYSSCPGQPSSCETRVSYGTSWS